MSLWFRFEHMGGGTRQIDCPRCGAAAAKAEVYERKETVLLFLILPLFAFRNTYVKCGSCGTKLRSRLRMQELLACSGEELAGQIYFDVPFVAKFLAVAGLALFFVPFVGPVLALLALLMTLRVSGWTRFCSLIGVGLGCLVTVPVLVLMLMQDGQPAGEHGSREVAAAPGMRETAGALPPPAAPPTAVPPAAAPKAADPEQPTRSTPPVSGERTEPANVPPTGLLSPDTAQVPEGIPPISEEPAEAETPFGPFAAASPVDAVQKMSDVFGVAKVAKLVMRGGEGLDLDRALQARLLAMGESLKPLSVYVFSQGNVTAAVIAPIADLDALAARIDFGTVTAVDGKQRKIDVALDRARFGGWEPAGGAPSEANVDPPAMSPIDEILADIKSRDVQQVNGALDRLEQVPVSDGQRQAVTGALLDVIGREAGLASAHSVELLARWHTPESIPAIAKLLGHESLLVRSKIYELLGTVQDERAASACAERLPEDRMHAGEALRAMGPVAETAVARLLRHSNDMVRSEACEILGDIGTKKSLRGLVPLTKDRSLLVRKAAEEAAEKIRARD